MKKTFAILLAAVMAVSFLSVASAQSVGEIVAEAAGLSHEELLEKAMAETGSFVAYGNTSRITTALEAFCALHGLTPEGNNLKDAEIYIKLENEINSGAKGADMVMIQDGASLKAQALANGWLVNFVPASVKANIGEADMDPLVHQYINKLFIWNKLEGSHPIQNVWQLTEEKMKGNVIFKNPESEQVNMNFLVMLTSEEWSQKLAAAYRDYFGKDVELGKYENAGYKWVAEFLQNCSFGNSDTTIAEEMSQPTAVGKIGLFVLSKLRSSSVITENLDVGSYLAAQTGEPVKPFAGFMYPMYAMVSVNARRPYTAMLFIEYLMSPEGFEPWGKSIGAYSSNAALPVAKGDLGIGVWKETLVMEDPDYILENYEKVSSFVIRFLQ